MGRHPDYGDEDVLYRDHFFLVCLTASQAASLSTRAVVEAGYDAHRWWTLVEIETTPETVRPDDLATIVRRALSVAAQTTGDEA